MFSPIDRAEVEFTKIAEIGQDGQNSKTFTARDHQLDADIVIKEIAKASLASPAIYFAESKALYASAHPNVVQLHYACQNADHIFIAMPYYANGSLKPLISDGSHLTIRRVVTLACQTLSALHNIHSKGLIHFDVKPDNILLSDRRDALLSDFGLAKQMTGGLAHPGKAYQKMIPPEALIGQAAFDLRWDIYQMGLTLYRMTVGNAEFDRQFASYTDAQTFRNDVLAGRFPDRKKFPPQAPSRLRTVIKNCLKVDPAERYQSAIEVANALALVDGKELDWQLSEVAGVRKWTKNENGISIVLEVSSTGEAQCYKQKGAGKTQRVTAMCRKVTDSEISRFLGKT